MNSLALALLFMYTHSQLNISILCVVRLDWEFN